MNFLGAGPMEVAIILLVAFIFLGPERMVTAARFIGKAVAELRRMTAGLQEAIIDADQPGPSQVPTPSQSDEPGAQSSGGSSKSQGEAGADRDGDPVAFQPVRGVTGSGNGEPKTKPDAE